ncbi:MAG: bifunctional nicotinamidase/pyrazinamidase [Thalassobaculum sp.]|uniref:bifunctional nicotinamidase/pyrazinamidase n=1 Tax=Thalassobaculum sp. TaxID=2022740 RepID=UPI0032EDD445
MAARDTEILIVVDVQNDFCPGGALAVPEGDAVVPVVNRLAGRFAHRILTQDWHPAGHSSFATSHDGRAPFETAEMPYGTQVLWPDHCVQGSAGAAFHPDLQVDGADLIIRKGFRSAIDSYSAFFENDRKTPTGLAGYLRDRGFDTVVMAGLATDFCVAYSALDARRLGFATTVVVDACRGIDLNGSLDAALKEMAAAGVALSQAATL